MLVLHWTIPDHRRTAEDFLLGDEAPENRDLGAGCLGSLLRGTRDPKGLRMLLSVFRNQAEGAPPYRNFHLAHGIICRVRPNEGWAHAQHGQSARRGQRVETAGLRL